MSHHARNPAGRSLNVILTVNAALLSALVWTQVSTTGVPGLSSSALAQQSPAGDASPQGIPNAGAQRQRMVQELQGIRDSIDGMRKQLDGGKVKVTIANVDDIKAAMKSSDDKGK